MNKYVRYVFVEFNKVHFYGLQRTFVNSRGFGPVEAMMTSVWFDTCVGPGRYHPRLMLWGRTVSIGEIGTETQNLSCSTKQVLKDSYWILDISIACFFYYGGFFFMSQTVEVFNSPVAHLGWSSLITRSWNGSLLRKRRGKDERCEDRVGPSLVGMFVPIFEVNYMECLAAPIYLGIQNPKNMKTTPSCP